jgi:hypothetical protein
MEARIGRLTLRIALVLGVAISLGASYRTQNFIVNAPTPELAKAIGNAAEKYRHDLAIEWLGKELPQWRGPCPITANVSDQLGAGGATSFVFSHGQVDWEGMNIQGSALRILDSVLPHEVTHTIFASHFRQPLPRWADEGACTTVEHSSERARHQQMLITFLRTGRGIAMSRLFAMKEYPPDVLPLYAQGYSVARYLIEQGGRRKYVNFVGDGLSDENWPRAMQKFYGDQSLAALQNRWLEWVKQGSPHLAPRPDQPGRAPTEMLASAGGRSKGGAPAGTGTVAAVAPSNNVVNHGPRPRPTPNLIYHVGRDHSLGGTQPGADSPAGSHPPARLVPLPAAGSVATATIPTGWHAAGNPGTASAGRTDALNPPPTPTAQPYQAVRQQPPQETQQTVLE